MVADLLRTISTTRMLVSILMNSDVPVIDCLPVYAFGTDGMPEKVRGKYASLGYRARAAATNLIALEAVDVVLKGSRVSS